MGRGWIMLIASLLVLLWQLPAAAMEPALRCEIEELRAANRKADCVIRERIKAARTGDEPTFGDCESQFNKDVEKAQERAAASGAVCPTVTDEAALVEYLPRQGNQVVVFIHTFSTETFDAGLQIVAEGFSAAIEAVGQVRRTYFLANRDALQVIAVSFFQKGESVEEWLASEERRKVLEQLEPLYAQPLVVFPQTVYKIHNSGFGSTTGGP